MAKCDVCGGRMIFVGESSHPSCADDPDAARIRAQHAAARTARDAGIGATVDANPGAMKAALRIITDQAHARETLSANTVRDLMDAAQIPGPVRGAAFRQAVADGLIEPAGMTASTQAETHAHRVLTYRSKLWRGVA